MPGSLNSADLAWAAMQVLKVYRSPRGFAIVPIHYSADPEKASPEWLRTERAKYADDATWAREMELDFAAHVGAPCYHAFRPHHLVDGLTVAAYAPLDLCMDFNANPMVWLITQVIDGWENVIEQIKMAPASISGMALEFRNRYPAHRAGLRIYGDSTGRGSDGHVGSSYYDLVELEFRGYPSKLEMRVGISNPSQLDRVAAANRRLEARDGAPGVRIDAKKCPDLVQDLQEVVWDELGKKILKTSDRANPYSQRTHASDAWSYKIAREFPIFAELIESERTRTPRRPVRPPQLLGMLR